MAQQVTSRCLYNWPEEIGEPGDTKYCPSKQAGTKPYSFRHVCECEVQVPENKRHDRATCVAACKAQNKQHKCSWCGGTYKS